MTLVALETSSRAASVAVRVEDRTLAANLSSERAHASDILPVLARLLDELGTTPSAIRRVFVGTGPGSYTGLRVGIATALGLQRGAGAEIVGVPSGETLVFATLPAGAEAVVLLDARQGELYFAHYQRTADDVRVLSTPRVVTPAELAGLLPPSVQILGDAEVARAASLRGDALALLTVPPPPHASALLELGRARHSRYGPHAPADVRPLYLRPFAATPRKR